ncbi:MAG: 6-bladed beta-propeller [Bacteroidales bacterium]
MNKFLSLLFIAAMASAILSCSGNKSKPESNGVKTISLPKAIGKERIVNLSEVAQSIRYVPLETNDSSLLGAAQRPILEDGVFYVMVSKASNKNEYRMFHIDGRFKGKLGTVGRAKGELPQIDPFSLSFDPVNGNPMICSFSKLVEYDKDGNFINEVYAPIDEGSNIRGYRIHKMGENYISLVNHMMFDKFGIISFNSNKEIIAESPAGIITGKTDESKNETDAAGKGEPTAISMGNPMSNSVIVVGRNPILYPYKKGFRYVADNGTEIYSIDEKLCIIPHYSLDFGKYKLPAKATDDDFNRSISFVSGFTCETDNYLFMTYNFRDNEPNRYTPPLVSALYDKTKEELILLKRDDPEIRGLKNDLDNGAPFWPVHISNEGEMIMPLSALKFIELSEKYNSAEMKKVAATLTENSNPVMVIAKTK